MVSSAKPTNVYLMGIATSISTTVVFTTFSYVLRVLNRFTILCVYDFGLSITMLMLLGYENVYLLFFSLKNKQQLPKPCDDAANNEHRNGRTTGPKTARNRHKCNWPTKKL